MSARPGSALRLGLAAALATLAADQISKVWLYKGFDLVAHEPVALGPFVNLIVVWNRGISYGLFQQHGDLGRWLLTGLSLAAAIALIAWMRRAESALLAIALGLVAGGAVGNAVDRIAYGAVFDFVHLHVGAWSWYVFNVADAAIVAGVVGLLYDAIVASRTQARRI